MAELRPFPFAGLVRRLFHELESDKAVFDLPRRKFFLSSGEKNLGVHMHGHRGASALGPAAGPQTQMAQNLVLSYLCGCRIMELKTVQINDQLEIPRPCIDMQNVGYNVEWSQELRLQESLEEYVKGSMLIEMILASGELEIPEGYRDYVFDMSAGYDLAGIQSKSVQAFIDGMMDCTDLVERLRQEIPEEYKQFRELEFRTKLSDSLTLSTFHGCPPDEIEKIAEFLLRDKGLHTIVKLNPTLLGPKVLRALLHEDLGYEDIVIPDAAFENDTEWSQAVGFVERLGALAKEQAVGFGVKFSNTLLVENHRDFFPQSEKQMYLSGPPLHVLAMSLVSKFRAHFADTYPISFSAGIDRNNFADAVAIGLTPVTVCSDLLKPGGYGRASGYLEVLCKRMEVAGALDIEDYVLKAYGLAEQALASAKLPAEVQEACLTALRTQQDLKACAGQWYAAWLSAAIVLNTEHYVQACKVDPRYHQEQNRKVPKKLGSPLALLDCVSCNKCIPVCPNDANFAFAIPKQELQITLMKETDGVWTSRQEGTLQVGKKAQYGNFADFCNECGNCDIFCPEDGGPYAVKGRFFGSLSDWQEMKTLDGFFVQKGDIYGRFSGQEFRLQSQPESEHYSGLGFKVSFAAQDPIATFAGQSDREVDLSYYYLMRWMLEAVLAESCESYMRYL